MCPPFSLIWSQFCVINRLLAVDTSLWRFLVLFCPCGHCRPSTKSPMVCLSWATTTFFLAVSACCLCFHGRINVPATLELGSGMLHGSFFHLLSYPDSTFVFPLIFFILARIFLAFPGSMSLLVHFLLMCDCSWSFCSPSSSFLLSGIVKPPDFFVTISTALFPCEIEPFFL